MSDTDTIHTSSDADQFGGQEDYFTFFERRKVMMPDGISWVEIEALNEGAKSRFQKSTSRDILMDRGGNSRVKMDQASERHELIKTSVKDWSLRRGAEAVPFTPRELDQFLGTANPKIVEKIESEIRKLNPWLLAELSVKDIDEQIEQLQDLRKIAEEREAGEAVSSSK
jgi:hypothetical protein